MPQDTGGGVTDQPNKLRNETAQCIKLPSRLIRQSVSLLDGSVCSADADTACRMTCLAKKSPKRLPNLLMFIQFINYAMSKQK